MKNFVTLVAILFLNTNLNAQDLITQPVIIYQTASAKLIIERAEVISEFVKFKNTSAYHNMSVSEKEIYEDAILFLSRSEKNIYLIEGERYQQTNLNLLNRLLSSNLLKEISYKKTNISVGN
jgi:hypothetical protein